MAYELNFELVDTDEFFGADGKLFSATLGSTTFFAVGEAGQQPSVVFTVPSSELVTPIPIPTDPAEACATLVMVEMAREMADERLHRRGSEGSEGVKMAGLLGRCWKAFVDGTQE